MKRLRAKAQEVASKSNLESIRLVSSECCRNLKKGPLPTVLHVDLTVQAELNEDTQQLAVWPEFVLTAKYAEGDEDIPLKIRARFQADYVVPLVESDAVFAFANATGPFNVWPYWREFVHSMTTRMGMPALTVPLFRLSAVSLEVVDDSGNATKTKKTAKRKRTKKPATGS
jgi:preprotein translocase subunit SecB